MGTVFNTIAAQDAIPVVINQKWMTEHGTSLERFISLIAKPGQAGIDTEMPVGPQFHDRRHGKYGIQSPQRTYVTAPGPSLE